MLEDGIIENVEELTGIKQEENKEDAEQADMNKPGDVDLAYFELRGKVKSFTERNDDNSISYSFTEKVSGIHIMVEVSKMLSLMLSVMPKNES